MRTVTNSSCSSRDRMGPVGFLLCFSSSRQWDSSSSFFLSSSSQKLVIYLGGADFLPDEPGCSFPFPGTGVSRFTRVVSSVGVVFLVGSAVINLTREDGQLVGQLGGPRRVKPSIMLRLIPHRLGTIWLGRMTWLVAMPSISCR